MTDNGEEAFELRDLSKPEVVHDVECLEAWKRTRTAGRPAPLTVRPEQQHEVEPLTYCRHGRWMAPTFAVQRAAQQRESAVAVSEPEAEEPE